MPPPQQAARYPERARRGEGYRKARAFGEKGIAPGPSGLYHYFGRRTEIAGPYRNARETLAYGYGRAPPCNWPPRPPPPPHNKLCPRTQVRHWAPILEAEAKSLEHKST